MWSISLAKAYFAVRESELIIQIEKRRNRRGSRPFLARFWVRVGVRVRVRVIGAGLCLRPHLFPTRKCFLALERERLPKDLTRPDGKASSSTAGFARADGTTAVDRPGLGLTVDRCGFQPFSHPFSTFLAPQSRHGDKTLVRL